LAQREVRAVPVTEEQGAWAIQHCVSAFEQTTPIQKVVEASAAKPQLTLHTSTTFDVVMVVHRALGLQQFVASAEAVHGLPVQVIDEGESISPFPPAFLHMDVISEPVTEAQFASGRQQIDASGLLGPDCQSQVKPVQIAVEDASGTSPLP